LSLLSVQTEFPEHLLTLPASHLKEILGQPTLFHLAGRRTEPLFVSVLLHGNEDVGWRAVQQVLTALQGQQLPRSLSLFVGNVDAAEKDVRRLDGQADYNRVWPGAEQNDMAEHAMMRQIVDDMTDRSVFASIDIHNNTGLNPYYGCVNRTDAPTLHLASLFSPTVVFFERPKGVQSMAFSPLCPSVTCECGKVGDAGGVERAAELLSACLHLPEFPHTKVPTGDIHLFHTVATVYVPQETTFIFGEDDSSDLQISAQLEHWNFQELGPGTEVAQRRPETTANFRVHDMTNCDVTDQFFAVESDTIRLRKSVMPAMLTLNHRVVQQDCLGYFMERLHA